MEINRRVCGRRTSTRLDIRRYKEEEKGKYYLPLFGLHYVPRGHQLAVSSLVSLILVFSFAELRSRSNARLIANWGDKLFERIASTSEFVKRSKFFRRWCG